MLRLHAVGIPDIFRFVKVRGQGIMLGTACCSALLRSGPSIVELPQTD